MSDVINIKEYKLAKVLVSDLEKIILIIDLTIQGLSYYKKYEPVSLIISNLQTNKTLLEISHSKYKRILEKK
jgi:hypothetical protein